MWCVGIKHPMQCQAQIMRKSLSRRVVPLMRLLLVGGWLFECECSLAIQFFRSHITHCMGVCRVCVCMCECNYTFSLSRRVLSRRHNSHQARNLAERLCAQARGLGVVRESGRPGFCAKSLPELRFLLGCCYLSIQITRH